MVKRFNLLMALASWLTLCNALPPSLAQQPDSAGLHALIPLPQSTLAHSLELTIGLGYYPPLGYGFYWEGRRYPDDLAVIQQRLNRTPLPQRARLYRQLGELYRAEGDPIESQRAFGTAVNLYAAQFAHESGSNRDGRLLTEYALALLRAGQLERAEQRIRGALRLAPDAWQTWAAAGEIRMRHAQGLADARGTADAARPAAPSIAQAAWHEAGKDCDRAVRLAPRLPQPYEQRAEFRWAFAFANHPALTPEALDVPDHRRAVALRQSNPYALALLAWLEYSDYGIRYFPGQSYDNFDVWKVLPPARRRPLLALRQRIERLTIGGAPLLRARALVALAWLEYEFHDVAPAQAQDHLRQALTLAPQLQEAEQLLMHTYAIEQQWENLVQFCDKQEARHPDVRYCLLAAYADYKAQRFEQAVSQANAAVQINPHDVAANLLLAYLLLRSNDPQRLQEAVDHLDTADAALQANRSTTTASLETHKECILLHGFAFALLGKREEARQQFNVVLNQDKDNTAARQALTQLQ
jgi:tetratricopeptide (TPR) repeat protein